GDDRLPDVLMPGREVEVPSLHRLAIALHADAVAGDFGHVDTGLEGAAVAGVHDHADVAVGVQFLPRNGELVPHVRRHRVALLGAIVHEPTHRAVDEQVEAVERRVLHHAAPGLRLISSAHHSARLTARNSAAGRCAMSSASCCAAPRRSSGSTTWLTMPSAYA